uniref:Uncharacterized protein n=1 Tax=CrAss-like virus sp. ctRQZ5 TaxID=2826824 RepID=A0A8S5LY20_9CAUD|nr:MAG TPA: hypothetical protein [CrAss-like virus sp. ctRQZ5]DAP51544.1 MAG TPA: hypothetical protein [Caudoviricetes sp.]DAU94391.1 MAG TPA: hypothetical protein [Caudoviricetes sp.]
MILLTNLIHSILHILREHFLHRWWNHLISFPYYILQLTNFFL